MMILHGDKELNMSVILYSGKVRTEFDKLFTAAGFKLANIIPTTIEISLIEADIKSFIITSNISNHTYDISKHIVFKIQHLDIK